MSDLKFTCKCIACGKRFDLTLDQVEEAQEVGCAISPCCNFPSTVEKAAYSKPVARKPYSDPKGGPEFDAP